MTNIWNGRNSIKNSNNLLYMLIFFSGTISANKTSRDFNQSIPDSILTILFATPVTLSNLHQPWFINRTNSPSNLDIATEIYLSSIRPNSSYVNSPNSLHDQTHRILCFRFIDQQQISNNRFVPMENSIEHLLWMRHNGPKRRIIYVRIYPQLIWKIFSSVCNNNWIIHSL